MDDHRLVRIVPAYGLDPVADAHQGAQLLAQLACETGFQRLARLALAARELPQTFEVGPLGAARDEVATGSILDDGSRDLDDDHARPQRRGAAAGAGATLAQN